MTQLLAVLQDVVSVAFVVLAIAIGIGWVRHREPAKVYLAASIGLLGLVAAVGRVSSLTGFHPAWLNAVSILAFLGSGYAVARMRSVLLPASAVGRLLLLVTTLGAAVLVLAAMGLGLVFRSAAGLNTIAALAVVAVWCLLVGEAIIRLAILSGSLRAVQRARLRALCAGLGGLVAVLAAAVIASPLMHSELVAVAIELLVLATVPLIYVGLEPPGWLRRHWRAAEEEGLQAALESLLVANPEPKTTAAVALEWAIRLVGADAGLMMRDQSLLAVRGMDPDEAAEVVEYLQAGPVDGPRTSLFRPGKRLAVVPLVTGGFKGQLVTLSGPISPIFGADESNRFAGYSTALAATLDRALLIEELRATNTELIEASGHKSTFLANMSHELRTPLNAILGFSELLIDDKSGDFDGPTRANFLTQIHQSGKHLLSLINDILDLSKVEAGQMELHTDRIDLAELIEGSVRTIRPLALAKRVAITVEPMEVGDITADGVRLHQVMLNLLSNAIKFTPEGGEVTVQTSRSGPIAEISVRDTGLGIKEADIPLLFEEFRQLDSAANRRQAGTGLGLALSKRFVELHGGHITVSSKPGEGSTFTIVLPAEPPPTPVATVLPPLASSSVDDGRPLVVIVEDNRQSADLLVRHLDRGGFRSAVATTGRQALEMVRQMQPVAVTLDIILPELDGWNILSELKADEACRDIPVVVVTVVDERDLGRVMGADDYFVKPVDAKALVAKIQQFALRSDARARDLKVLVVDDDSRDLERNADLLRNAGFRVVQASGGKECIEMVRSESPDLLLLDLMMPGMTGFDVVAELRENGSRDLPILIVSAKDLTAEDKSLLSGQVAAIVQKQAGDNADLIRWLRTIVEDRPSVPA